MKKITYIILCAVLFSCTKNNDFVKEELEKALPTIEVTSLGLVLQTGPFLQTDVIQVTFGGAITKAEAGVLDLAWYDAPSAGTPTRVDSVHFNSWNEVATTATGNNSVITSLIPTSYPNTQAFSGNLILKLTRLAAGSKSYTLRVYASTRNNKKAIASVTKLITIK